MCSWIWTFCTFYLLTFSKSDSWQACTHLFFCYLKFHVFHHILFLAFLVPYMFAIHYSSILVLLQSIYLTQTPAISPVLLLQDSPPPFGARFSPFCPPTHNAPWVSALEPSRHSRFPRLSHSAHCHLLSEECLAQTQWLTGTECQRGGFSL